jgi:outer membrane protein assembly factor BamB
MRSLFDHDRSSRFLVGSLAAAFCAVALWSLRDWTLQANQPATRLVSQQVSSEIPFEQLYARNGSLYRNFRYAVQSDDETRAVALAQSILQAEEDHFVAEQNGRTHSLKKFAFDYLESLPYAQFRKYQQQWELDAEVLLDDAEESDAAVDYLKLVDRYYFTPSGYRAVDWLATRALDLGQFETASRLWNDAIDSPVHSSRIDAQVLFKAAVANRLAGHGERAAVLMNSLVDSAEGRKLSLKLEDYLRTQASESSFVPSAHSPRLVEEWQVSLVENLSETEISLLNDWRQEDWANRKTLSIASSAVVKGNLMIVRGYNGLHLINTETGQFKADYPLTPNLKQAASEFEKSRLDQQRWGRLSSRAEFYESFVWNTLHTQLSSDHRHVYLIEDDPSWQDTRPGRPGEQFRVRPGEGNRNPANAPVPFNRLVALPFKNIEAQTSEAWEPVWQLSSVDEEQDDFRGVYFLSPPVNIDGALYTVGEQEEAIRLFCIDPSNGRLLWSQGLGFPMAPLYEDSSRRFRGCVVRAAGDKLIVTTQAGLVVAMDPVRRTLEWVYYLGQSPSRQQFAFRGRDLDQSLGFLGFLDEPVVDHHHLYLLPRQSKQLHCVDLNTGRLLWKVNRNQPTSSSDESAGDEYLGGVWENVLLVVGSQETRGVSTQDGRELWKSRHRRISGHGVQQDGEYLLPLENSQILRIGFPDGRSRTISLGREAETSPAVNLSGVSGDQAIADHPAPSPLFGHLLVANDRLISLGIDSLTALPEPVMYLDALERMEATGKLSAEQQFRLIELEPQMTATERVDAFESLLSADLEEKLRKRIEAKYQDDLFELIQQEPERIVSIAEKLKQFQASTDDEIRLLIHLSVQQMKQQQAGNLLFTLKQLGELKSESLFEVPGERGLSVSLGAWMRSIWDWSQAELEGPLRAGFEDYLSLRIQQAVTTGQKDQMERLLDQFPGVSQLDSVRLELAPLCIAEKQYHEAEMLLMAVMNRGEKSLSPAATIQLAQLWHQFGLSEQAVTLLDNLDQIEVSGLSGEFQNQLTTFQSTPEIKAALFNRGLPAEELTQVTVESLQPGRPQTILKESHDGYRRIYPTPMSCAFDLLAKEHPEQVSTHHLLEIVSRSEGVVAARMSLPIRGDYERDSSRSVVGHLFPYGSMGQIRGVSLLDTASGKPAWTRSFLDPEMGEILQVGPFDSEIILFRNQNTLLAVDARNGRVFWRRDDLVPYSDARSKSRHPLFGDQRVVVRQVGSQADYEIYRSFTGQQVAVSDAIPKTGSMGTVGRLMVMIRYVGESRGVDANGRRPSVSVVDMETGKEVFASPYWSQYCSHLDGDRLVLIDHEKHLRVIDLMQRAELVSIPTEMGESTSVNRLHYMEDARNHYINIQRVDDHQRVGGVGGDRVFSNFASNPFLPTTDIVGLLIAVDKKTGKRSWDRMLNSCSIVHTPYESPPFLTTLSWRTKQRVPNTRRLHIEALSQENGNTLGVSDDFVPLDQLSQLFQARYQRAAGYLELNGPTYRARIKFNPSRDREILAPGPF